MVAVFASVEGRLGNEFYEPKIILFENNEDAVMWMVNKIVKYQPDASENIQELIDDFQDSLGGTEYFHVYEVDESQLVKEPA